MYCSSQICAWYWLPVFIVYWWIQLGQVEVQPLWFAYVHCMDKCQGSVLALQVPTVTVKWVRTWAGQNLFIHLNIFLPGGFMLIFICSVANFSENLCCFSEHSLNFSHGKVTGLLWSFLVLCHKRDISSLIPDTSICIMVVLTPTMFI